MKFTFSPFYGQEETDHRSTRLALLRRMAAEGVALKMSREEAEADGHHIFLQIKAEFSGLFVQDAAHVLFDTCNEVFDFRFAVLAQLLECPVHRKSSKIMEFHRFRSFETLFERLNFQDLQRFGLRPEELQTSDGFASRVGHHVELFCCCMRCRGGCPKPSLVD